MKIFMTIRNLLISMLLAVGMFVVYDLYLLSYWAEIRLLDKFVVHVILKENANVESIIDSINTAISQLKIKELTFITKQQIFDEVKQNDELRIMLGVLNENPFFDVLRIKFNNYLKQEFDNVMKVVNANISTKYTVYDHNLKLYLDRVTTFKFVWTIASIVLLVLVLLLIFLNGMNITTLHFETFNIFLFTIMYFAMIIFNLKMLNFITGFNLSKINIQNTVVYVIVYIVTLQNVGLQNKKDDIEN